MLQKDKKERNQLEFVSIEALVPEEHLLRKIDAAVDFNKIYEFVEDLYCPDCGTRQALRSIGVDTAEQEQIIETIHRHMESRER